MNFKNIIKQTWATGLLLFGFLAFRDKTTDLSKTTNEVITEDTK